MPKGSIRNPDTKKTNYSLKKKRRDAAASEWDLYRGAGKFGRETSGKGTQITPSLPYKKPTTKAMYLTNRKGK